MQVLAKAPEVAACFVSTAYRYAHGRTPEGPDRCALERVGQRFESQGGDLIELAVALTADESFLARQ
jgi:hypothetical protein